MERLPGEIVFDFITTLPITSLLRVLVQVMALYSNRPTSPSLVPSEYSTEQRSCNGFLCLFDDSQLVPDDSRRSLGKAAYWLDGGTLSTYVNGSLHWLTQCHKFQRHQDIVRFDLATEEFRKVPSPSVDYGGLNVKESWATEFSIPAHVPVELNVINLSRRMVRKWFATGSVLVLCLLQTGEFLLEYGNQALVSYDPHQEEFKKLDSHGLPNCFETVIFKGSLLPLQDSTEM
ncbi:hypothetical protein Sjap_025106 [Stephania japonica]|uniref:F-box protein n=1 Tax=Stephania japonica TaxID=461633 RepID=A0AAP0E3S0_9MAGN